MHVQITRGKRKACFSWLPRHEPQRPGPTVVGASPALGGGAERSHESGGLNAVVAWKSPRLRLASAERARTPPSFSGPAGPQVRWLVLAKSTRALERACPFPAPWTGALPLGPPRGRFRGPGKTKRKLVGREASRGPYPAAITVVGSWVRRASSLDARKRPTRDGPMGGGGAVAGGGTASSVSSADPCRPWNSKALPVTTVFRERTNEARPCLFVGLGSASE